MLALRKKLRSSRPYMNRKTNQNLCYKVQTPISNITTPPFPSLIYSIPAAMAPTPAKTPAKFGIPVGLAPALEEADEEAEEDEAEALAAALEPEDRTLEILLATAEEMDEVETEAALDMLPCAEAEEEEED